MLRCSGVDGAREFGKQAPRRAKYLQNQPCFNKDTPPPARPRRIITVPESVLCLLFYIIVFGKARQRGNKVRGLSSVLQKRKTRPTRNSFVSFFGVVVHATLYTHPEPNSSTPLHPPPTPARAHCNHRSCAKKNLLSDSRPKSRVFVVVQGTRAPQQ